MIYQPHCAKISLNGFPLVVLWPLLRGAVRQGMLYMVWQIQVWPSYSSPCAHPLPHNPLVPAHSGLNHLTCFDQWDVSKREAIRAWKSTPTIGLTSSLPLPLLREGNAQASLLTPGEEGGTRGAEMLAPGVTEAIPDQPGANRLRKVRAPPQSAEPPGQPCRDMREPASGELNPRHHRGCGCSLCSVLVTVTK